MIKKQKILIVAPAWVGDAVMSLGLIQSIKESDPYAEITVLCVPWCEAVFRVSTAVTAIIPMNIPHGVFGFKARLEMARYLRGEKFDIAYVLPNSWKSALVPFLARIPVRIGYVGEMRWGLLTHAFKKDEHFSLLVDKYQALAGIKENFLRPKLQINASLDKVNTLLHEYFISLDKPIISFCPGAEYGPAKQWPASYYAEIAQVCIARGWQVWLFGSPKDKAVADEISKVINTDIVNWVGKTTLEEAIYLLALSRSVITNDSGLMHVAAALDLPTIALFGSSDPCYTPPLSSKAKVLYLKVQCSPCFKRICPLKGEEYMKCLRHIRSNEVVSAIDF